MKTLLFLLALTSFAFAEEELLLRLEVKSQGSNRSLSHTVRIQNGGSGSMSVSPQEKKEGVFEVWRFHPTRLSSDKIRLESQLDVRLDEGPRQHSKFSTTLLEGEPWEASVDTPDGKATLDYRITAWKIPAGQRLLKFDKDGRPQWVTPGNY